MTGPIQRELTAEQLAFKQDLRALIDGAASAAGRSREAIAARAKIDKSTLSRAHGDNYPMPKPDLLARIVDACHSLIDETADKQREPGLPPEDAQQRKERRQHEIRQWHARLLSADPKGRPGESTVRPQNSTNSPTPTDAAPQPVDPPDPGPTPSVAAEPAPTVSRPRTRWRRFVLAAVIVVAAATGITVATHPWSSPVAACGAAPDLRLEAGECVGVGDDRFDLFDPGSKDIVDQIHQQNEDAAASGDFVNVGVLGPLSQSPAPGQLDREQVRQLLIGLAVAQRRVNSDPVVGDPRPRIRLVLANQGSHQDHWRTPVDELIAMSHDPGRGLVAVVSLGTSVRDTRDALKALAHEGIPVIGTITTADELDYRNIPGMVRVVPPSSDLVAALADYLPTRPDLAQGIVVWDENSEERGDLYTGSLKDAFHAQLGRWIGARPDQGFIGATIPGDDRPDMFDTITINVCQSGANVVLYAGRVSDLPPFIDSMSRRACRDRSVAIMTGVSALTTIDRTKSDELRNAGLAVVYAGVVDPHAWPQGKGDPPRGYRDYVNALIASGYPPDTADAYTCLAHDAALTAARAIRLVTASPRRRPTPGDVRSELRNINGAYTIAGCSGSFAFTTTSDGSPEGTPTPIVTIPADYDHPASTRVTRYP